MDVLMDSGVTMGEPRYGVWKGPAGAHAAATQRRSFQPRRSSASVAPRQDERARRDDGEAQRRRHVGQPEEAIAKPVNHIEERIRVRQRLPERRQRMDRVEHAGQKRERRDQEILERRELVELFGPEAADEPERAEDRAAEEREASGPERMRHVRGATGTKNSVTMKTPRPTTSPRIIAPSTYAAKKSAGDNGGSRMKMRLPVIFDWIIDDELLANAFCSTDIITSPGTRNAV